MCRANTARHPALFVEHRRDRNRCDPRRNADLHRRALQHPWNSNRYVWNGHWLGTHAPIDGTTKKGFGGLTNFFYNGKHLGINGHYDHIGPTFRNTDLGFLQSRVNKNEINGGLNLNQPDPKKVFRFQNYFVTATRRWNADGLVFDKYIGVGTNLDLKNFWYVYLNYFYNFARLDDLDTRGGPPIVRPKSDNINFGIGTDSRKRWNLFTNSSFGHDAGGGWNGFFAPNLRLQPSSRLQTSIGLSYNWGVDAAQWIQNIDADGDGVEDNVYGTFAAECREHHRARDVRIQPRHDARGVPATLRRRRQLHQHREARPSELLRFRAGHSRRRS